MRLALASAKLPVEQWDSVLPDALHSIRSFLSTATNATPHERFLSFPRKSSQGVSLPSWLSPGSVLLRKFLRSNKQDDLMEKVELTHVNPIYAYIRYKDGRESTVSLSDLAPFPRNTSNIENSTSELINDSKLVESKQSETIEVANIENVNGDMIKPVEELRRSTQLRKRPERYGFQDG